jgi:histidinol-phosphatase
VGVDELELARQLADIAAEIATRYFTRDPAIYTKDDGTLVTIADREIEQALRERIDEQFPAHAVLGEEEGLKGDAEGPVWIIDPIDGTNNFAWGIPIFATLIALRISGRSEIGIVSAPALGESYEAVLGEGARMNGNPIRVSDVSTVEQARVNYASWSGWEKAGLEDRWEAILRRCLRSRGFGDFWGHMLVARGASDVMAEPDLAIWDVAALEVIVAEAGGRLTSFDGTPYGVSTSLSAKRLESVLTTNGLLHDELVATLSAEPNGSGAPRPYLTG